MSAIMQELTYVVRSVIIAFAFLVAHDGNRSGARVKSTRPRAMWCALLRLRSPRLPIVVRIALYNAQCGAPRQRFERSGADTGVSIEVANVRCQASARGDGNSARVPRCDFISCSLRATPMPTVLGSNKRLPVIAVGATEERRRLFPKACWRRTRGGGTLRRGPRGPRHDG